MSNFKGWRTSLLVAAFNVTPGGRVRGNAGKTEDGAGWACHKDLWEIYAYSEFGVTGSQLYVQSLAI